MKDSYYFPHDYHARHDYKLNNLFMDHGVQGLGAFWCLVEMLYEEGGTMPTHYERIAKALRVEMRFIETLINDYDLFHVNGTEFWSDSVKRRLDHIHIKSDLARASANKRWKNDAKAMPTQCDGNAVKESKGKEIINTYPEPVRLVFDFFCSVTNKNFQLSPDRAKIIQQRLKEGRTIEEMKTAIENFSKDPWEDRHRFIDIVYVLGTIKKINNLDKWLSSPKSSSKVLEGF